MNVVPLEGPVGDAVLALAEQRGVFPHHHPVWLDIFRGMGEDCRGLVAMDTGRVLGWLLYTVRAGSRGTVVSSLPYIAYGGPATPEANPSAVAALLEALRAEAEYLQADVLTLGTSPFLSLVTEDAYREVLRPAHQHENFVQLHDISVHPLEQLSKKRRDAIRSEVRRAEREGLRIVSELTPLQFTQWRSIYEARYEELGATPYPATFHQYAYQYGVPAGVVEFWGVLHGDSMVGGVMFLASGETADYFHSAFSSAYRHLYPNTYLLNEAFSVLGERGVRRFNWQSSTSRGGVYQYKARWGAHEGRHFYMSVLLNPETELLRTTATEVKNEFPLRFVLPFSLLPQQGTADAI